MMASDCKMGNQSPQTYVESLSLERHIGSAYRNMLESLNYSVASTIWNVGPRYFGFQGGEKTLDHVYWPTDNLSMLKSIHIDQDMQRRLQLIPSRFFCGTMRHHGPLVVHSDSFAAQTNLDSVGLYGTGTTCTIWHKEAGFFLGVEQGNGWQSH